MGKLGYFLRGFVVFVFFLNAEHSRKTCTGSTKSARAERESEGGRENQTQAMHSDGKGQRGGSDREMAERWSRSWSAPPARCRLGNQGYSDARSGGGGRWAVGGGWWEHADGNTGLGLTGRCHTSNGMVRPRSDMRRSAESMSPEAHGGVICCGGLSVAYGTRVVSLGNIMGPRAGIVFTSTRQTDCPICREGGREVPREGTRRWGYGSATAF